MKSTALHNESHQDWTLKYLKEILEYNEQTGIFTWKENRGSNKTKGKIADNKNLRGYITIGINGKRYKAHRLAWLYIYGDFPKGQIDHINGVRDDNRIENLRIVTNRQNCQNYKIHREGKLVGNSFHKNNKKWQSSIVINGKQKYLGYYETQQEAHEAYLNKLKELNNEA
jgi:hypothetical protein